MSIDCYDGEPVEASSERRVRARINHSCDACGRAIERGHIYIRDAILFEGSWDVVKRCMGCEEIYQHLQKLHSEARAKYDHDDYPDRRLSCGHTYQERWGVEAPSEIARIAFMTPAEMQAEFGAKP